MVRVVLAIVALAAVAGVWYATSDRNRTLSEDAYEVEMARLFMSTIPERNREPGFEALYGVGEKALTPQQAYDAAMRLTPPPSKRTEHAERAAALRNAAELFNNLDELTEALAEP